MDNPVDCTGKKNKSVTVELSLTFNLPESCPSQIPYLLQQCLCLILLKELS